jgi:beta-lactamase superfamily II metal-dependent hydrolase
MLTFHILNVLHGLSVVIEYQRKGDSFYGVVDSNIGSGQTPKALLKLRELGADSLSFLCLTHPHRDHFSGLYSIIQEYRNRIGTFYSFPMGDLLANRKRLSALGKKLYRLTNETDAPEIRHASLELLQIIKWADSKEAEWYECAGDRNEIAPPGFTDVEIATILPPRQVKAQFIDKIERQDLTVLGNLEDNDLSLAIELRYCNKKMLIGGDGTKANWDTRRRFEGRQNQSVQAPLINLPHHGSQYDCTPEIQGSSRCPR